jgi:hypothetical protein
MRSLGVKGSLLIKDHLALSELRGEVQLKERWNCNRDLCVYLYTPLEG